MNKSYSKIRHIQEANKMLEKRLLLENDTESMTPTQQELISIDKDPNKNEKEKLGRKLFDLFVANQPPTRLRDWLDKNGYRKIIKRLESLKKEEAGFGPGVLTTKNLILLVGDYFNDSKLKSNVDIINQEHIEDYKKLHSNP